MGRWAEEPTATAEGKAAKPTLAKLAPSGGVARGRDVTVAVTAAVTMAVTRSRPTSLTTGIHHNRTPRQANPAPPRPARGVTQTRLVSSGDIA